MRLADLNPQVGDKPDLADASFNFRCPLCGNGRIVVWVVLGGEPRNGAHVANVLPPAWDAMSLTPSVADEGRCTGTNRGCPGWHGHIINGEAVP
jgi:hypothetical protein